MSTIGTAALVMGVAGTAVSIYGSNKSAADQRAAASQNAELMQAQARATAAVARYQARLNYKTAIAQADVGNQNATMFHGAARLVEKQGAEGINRLAEGQEAQNSANRAAVSASGVTSDSGSPLVVNAYNAGMQQLQRLDALYNTNMAAADKDWAGTMQSYQSAITRETAKQYQYAQAMANWNEKMGISSAGVQQQQANNAADATQIAGYGNALSQFASAASNYGYASMQASSLKNTGIAGITPNQYTTPSSGSLLSGFGNFFTPFKGMH
jgi:hypothetical protein